MERLQSKKTEKAPLQHVIDGGYCIGCGVCAAFDQNIRISLDETGRMQAEIPKGHRPSQMASKVCPFSGEGPNEDTLAYNLFNAPGVYEDASIGRHLACYAGWVSEGQFRERGSSGGMGSWLQYELLRLGYVDAILNVESLRGSSDANMFAFTVSHSTEEVIANSKTRYYPVEMSGVIKHVLDKPGRYALIGTPCFVKAIRLAAIRSPELQQRIKFALGIVCGHLKTAAFADALAEQCGIDAGQIETIDFRTKLAGRPASRYGVSISGRRSDSSSQTVIRPMEGLIASDWGHGLFKYKACEFCDDVLAETADVVVGDAWLPRYDSDHLGANIAVVRNQVVLDLIERARLEGRLQLDELAASEVAQSQAGGLRHRREGLSYRLWLTDKAGEWRPKKRVAPGRRHLSPSMRRLHEARFSLGQVSHLLWRDSPNFEVFASRIAPHIAAYDNLVRPTVAKRLLNFLCRKLDSMLFRLGLRRN